MATAVAAVAEDLRFGGCGKKFGRFRAFCIVFGWFWQFSDIFARFRAFWDVFGAKLRKLLIAETVLTWGYARMEHPVMTTQKAQLSILKILR